MWTNLLSEPSSEYQIAVTGPVLQAVGERVRPRSPEVRELPGVVGVDAHLEERPLLAGLELRREFELVEDVRALAHHEFGGLGRPLAAAFLERGLADPRALLEVLVGPDVDDLVEGADLGVPERGELREFLAGLVGLRRSDSRLRAAIAA